MFLHGRAASGKLTTARELHRLVGYPVFHNHLVVDTLTTVFPFGTEPFVRLRERFWLDVFAEAAASRRSLVFTFTPEPTVLPGFAERVRQVVERSAGRVHFVRLAVSDSDQEARVANPDRSQLHKLADVATLRASQGQPGAEQPEVHLEIDTSSSAPAESARRIVEHFELAPQPRRRRYLD